MPISTIVGRSDIMNKMEDIFFSGTFGGEALSLAAAIATLKKIRTEPVIEHLWSFGEKLSERVHKIIQSFDLEEIIGLTGYAPWKILKFNDNGKHGEAARIKTFFMQEMIKRGILILGSHNISYAHNNLDLDIITLAYENVLELLKKYLMNDTLQTVLLSPEIKPIFKVRSR